MPSAEPVSVDLHWLDLDDPALDAERLMLLLGKEERERAALYRFDRNRRRYVVRRSWLRQLLSQALDCEPQAIRYAVNSYGKLSLRGTDLRFNLSHSHGVALIVLARGLELGCDIEKRDPDFAAEQIPERFFAPAEVSALRALPAGEQLAGFFNAWTRKEAYIKARGYGLSLPLDSFEVELRPAMPPVLLRACDGWSLQCCEPVPGYPAAIVAEGKNWQLRLHPPEAAYAAA